MCLMPRYPGIHGLSTISAIGILSNFSRRAARLNISHCSGNMAVPCYVRCGTDHRFLWSVGMGLRPAKFHEKLASWQGGSGEVGVTVEKSRSLVCLTRSMRALRE